MKNSKMRLCAILLLASFTVTGCGEKAMQLTDTEESLIVNYAAHVVSKYNTRQPDGLVHVRIDETQLEEEATETVQEENTESLDSTSTNTNTGQSAEAATEEVTEQVTLSQALGLDAVTAEVTGTELKKSYVEADYYAMDASNGKIYLMLSVALKNNGTEDATCDMLTAQPTFKLAVNDTVNATAQTTILLNDLGTYQGTIAAGESQDTVLLFEVPEDTTEISSLVLTVKRDGTSYDVTLQ